MQSGQGAVVAGSSDVDLHELTRRRAEEIYILNGRIPGHDIENWTQAEQEIRAEFERAIAPNGHHCPDQRSAVCGRIQS